MLGNALTVLLLVDRLVLWISLPWIGVLAVAILVALWLLLTRGGRLALAATRIGVASLPQRWGASSVIVVGIAGVVGVLVAMLAMGQGFQATLNNTGDDTTAIVLRGGSMAETNSVITRERRCPRCPPCPASAAMRRAGHCCRRSCRRWSTWCRRPMFDYQRSAVPGRPAGVGRA